MENYLKYKLMGSVKRIRLKPDCVPSRFHSRKHKSDHTSDDLASKRLRISENSLQGALHIEEDIAETSSFCTEDSQTSMENKYDKAVQVAQIQEHSSTQVILIQKHKAIQARIKTQCKSKQVQTGVKTKDIVTSPIKFITSTATSPLKPNPNIKSATNPSTSNTVSRKLRFIEENCDSDTSCAPSLVGSTVDQDYSPSETSVSKATSDASLQAERKKFEKINLKSTLSKIINKPKLYIGLSKNLYFLIDLIKKHTNLTEQNILLCLMKIKLNRTFTQLGDDFDLSVTQASNIFFNSMPEIVKVLSPFIKHFSKATIKKNLPIAFRHRYNQVTCIIDCLEIEIQKPSKAVHQALSWSEYKKTNTIKYLISCTPDGLVNFVSNGYAGRISDVNLLEDSNFLECLPAGSYILADRGFKHLESYLAQKGFVLLRPPSVPAGTKLSKAEVKQTKQIASLRIHVERVIRRLREFSILKMHSVVNSNLVGLLDLCIKTACALINLQDSLIK
ncbi:uncharacterized protein LOC111354348 isoform X2 [Spodoptera litura]|nr:uncharacterized protein LOC111354348 isoform X2 [Spodoptera litura]